jgi:hypothetical protein
LTDLDLSLVEKDAEEGLVLSEVADEVAAMQAVATALSDLDQDAKKRVLAWANDKFMFERPVRPTSHQQNSPETTVEASGFDSLAELFDAVGPETDKDKALVAAFWEASGDGATFSAQSLNTQLKHLGHGVGNITRALSLLADEKPALVLQVRKSGNSRQARKLFKVTEAGRKRVLAMIKKGAQEIE